MDQAQKILDVERMNLMTLDNKFHKTLERTQSKSHREQYEVVKAAYYAVASKRFVDNICM
ncbi:hypothetical protein PENPOL_c001G09839 [Penicillium polonicum]|uniref:Uncharacterized protein n=1 Tax=Penicillium polonicum TaxID=60169 RepID=A0A1V6P649_PENPO|nr:hypothetical protein PENPOL_c001G09839 [Penicillium polonicum]